MNKKLKRLLESHYFSDGVPPRPKESAERRARDWRARDYNARTFEAAADGRPNLYYVLIRPRCLAGGARR